MRQSQTTQPVVANTVRAPCAAVSDWSSIIISFTESTHASAAENRASVITDCGSCAKHHLINTLSMYTLEAAHDTRLVDGVTHGCAVASSNVCDITEWCRYSSDCSI